MFRKYACAAISTFFLGTVIVGGYGFYRVVDKIRSFQSAWFAQVDLSNAAIARLEADLVAQADASKAMIAHLESDLHNAQGEIEKLKSQAGSAMGPYNVGFGPGALNSATTGYENTAVGDKALQSLKTGGNTTAVGSRSMMSMVDPFDVTAFGARTLANAKTGVGDTAIGFRSLEHATVARNNTGVGDSALWQYQGTGSVAVGYVVAEYWRRGDHNVAIGVAAARNRGSGSENVLIGTAANGFPSVVVDDVSGDGGVDAGDGNVGVGHAVMLNVYGDNSVFIGRNAGNHQQQKRDVKNSISIGANTYTTNDNQIVIGNENITEIVIGGVVLAIDDLREIVSSLNDLPVGCPSRLLATCGHKPRVPTSENQ